MIELNTQNMDELKKRYIYFVLSVIVAFLVVLCQLWNLQVIKGSEHRRLSENNRIRIKEKPAVRGMLLDRNGFILAHNRPSFEVYLVPEDIKGDLELVKDIEELLNLSKDEVKEKLDKKQRVPFKPIKIKSDIDWRELSLLEFNRIRIPGLIVDVRFRRAYNYGDLASHLLGYLGEVDESDLKQKKGYSYRLGSLVGKYGVEYQWDSDLRGIDGGQQVEVDAIGREVRPLRSIEPFPGNNVFLTIDLDIQKAAEEAFEGKNGVLIAMDPKTGYILAMLSKPSFNPDMFAQNLSAEEWKSLLEDPDNPLQNKGIQGIYPPGSVFKIITAIAGLESGVITPKTQFNCSGSFIYGNREFKCWKDGGHGSISLHRALVESCDIYFYQVGLKVGVDKIAHYAHMFGLGKKTGIMLPFEKAGIVPSSSWKKRYIGVSWYSGETIPLSVGQGYLAVTPIQLLNLISAIANGGKIYLPQVVEKVVDINGNILKNYPPRELGRVNISEETLHAIQEALKGAVNEPGGTGNACALADIKVAGKTGTAQVARISRYFRRGEITRLPQKLRDHAWFVAYAPFESPEISIVVLVEHGGYGGAVAAPIAKKVFERYFNLKQERNLKLAEKGRQNHDD